MDKSPGMENISPGTSQLLGLTSGDCGGNMNFYLKKRFSEFLLLLTNFIRDERKRYQKPFLLLVISVGFILAPVFNTIYNSLFLHINIVHVWRGYHPLAYLLMSICILNGIGLLLLHRWSWYLFLVVAVTILSYNLYCLTEMVNVYNISLFAQSLGLFLVIAYFLRMDILAPFFATEPRGFRKAKRTKTQVNILVDNLKFVTEDISSIGLSVAWPDCNKNIGDEVGISFLMHSKPVEIKAGITRIDKGIVALAFRR